MVTNELKKQQFAPPMGKEKHWKDGRSAKSLAQFMTDKHQIKKLDNILTELGYDTSGRILYTPEANTTLPGTLACLKMEAQLKS